MEESEIPFAFVDVILPLALPKAYTYQITEAHYDQLAPGFRVAVPFGKQKVYTAVVLRVHRVAPQTYEPKPIMLILDKIARVTPIQLEFWEWMARYYMCSMGDIMRASLPAALLIESQTILIRNEVDSPELETLTDEQFLVFEALQKQTLSLEEISQITDQKKVMPLVLDMLEKGVALIYQKIEEKFKPKKVRYIRLSPIYEEKENLESLFKSLKNAPRQAALVMGFLSDSNSSDNWQKVSDFKQRTQASSSQIRTLLDKAVFEELFQEEHRVLIRQQREQNSEKVLSAAQKIALQEIQTVFQTKEVVLFEGVTASGKTEVYIKLIEEQLSKGKQILYLLPEISLTSQIVTRLAAHFGDQVSVYHSKYSIHERTEVWQKTLEGSSQGQIIVGARSAVLLPFQDLGLVLIDEEHENSYKQFDPAPRYQARDSAIFLARRMNAKVLLGSATPSLETAENVRSSKYGWVKLSERYGGVSLPRIELIDLKEAHRKKTMNGMFSETLIHSIRQTLVQKKQVILFQNRRGYAPISECVSCGHSPECTQCDVSLTYHQTKNQLKCHYCGYTIPMPSQCHACGMPTLTTKGVGTQQIEEQLKIIFPEANVARMDWDSTRGKWDFDRLIERFDKEELQILVGTQMVVKGLDFKNVLLVGVINADQLINFPDFRAHERSYQMLCQVAGRAGRSSQKGKVLIQTYQPHHPLLKQVIEHDYESLYHTQKKERLQYRYPPYYRMIRITFKSRQFQSVNMASDWFCNVIKQIYNGSILGPVFPAVARVRNKYQKQMIVKVDATLPASEVKKLLTRSYKSFQSIAAFRSIRVNFDVDPY